MDAKMKIDIRIPIGGMFTLIGAIITIFGLISDKKIYEHSLGININLWWGLVMLAFGVFMLIMAWHSSRTAKNFDTNGTSERR